MVFYVSGFFLSLYIGLPICPPVKSVFTTNKRVHKGDEC